MIDCAARTSIWMKVMLPKSDSCVKGALISVVSGKNKYRIWRKVSRWSFLHTISLQELAAVRQAWSTARFRLLIQRWILTHWRLEKTAFGRTPLVSPPALCQKQSALLWVWRAVGRRLVNRLQLSHWPEPLHLLSAQPLMSLSLRYKHTDPRTERLLHSPSATLRQPLSLSLYLPLFTFPSQPPRKQFQI